MDFEDLLRYHQQCAIDDYCDEPINEDEEDTHTEKTIHLQSDVTNHLLD